jgi:hypothetical protein
VIAHEIRRQLPVIVITDPTPAVTAHWIRGHLSRRLDPVLAASACWPRVHLSQIGSPRRLHPALRRLTRLIGAAVHSGGRIHRALRALVRVSATLRDI